MKYRVTLILLLALSIHCLDLFSQDDLYRKGLFFSSHEVISDKRTSLCLTPDKPLSFNASFSILFDANFRQGDGYYGLICRIIGNESTNIDLISSSASITNADFWLVVKDTIPISFKLSEIPNGALNSWIKVRIDFDLKESKISMSFNGSKKERVVKKIAGLHDFEITFGACKNLKFLNTDVSPMTLKDVVITDQDSTVIREWKLSAHSINAVYDEVCGTKATVNNGVWLTDKHLKWVKQRSIKMPNLLGIAKNEQEGVFYLIGKKFILASSVSDNQLDTILYSNGCPYSNFYNFFVYDHAVQEIVSYDFSSNTINRFNFESRAWSQSDTAYKEPDYSHHTKVISPINGTVVTFGGYGHYTYKSQFHSYNGLKSSWSNTDASKEITPRYLSASGLDENNNWLIFGGYGSKSGRQEVSAEYFYDVYSVDLKSFSVRKLCTFNDPKVPFVPCETLIKKPGSDSFYTLIYNNGKFASSLKLAEFDIKNAEYTVFPDSIPYNFSDVESFCTFFLHQKTSQLFAVTVHQSDVEMYSLAYPPLSTSDVIQKESADKKWIIWVLIGIVAVIGFICIRLRCLKRKKTEKEMPHSGFPSVGDVEGMQLENFEIPSIQLKSSICLLGGFQVFDKTGEDITALFTPMLKQLFILVFLYTVKTGRGISTSKLNEILWFDKSEASAKNNRNVSISKLRGLLGKVGTIDLEQESTYWRVRMDGIYSDYRELISLGEKYKVTGAIPTESEIFRYVQVASSGELLPDVQIDWIDDFKADFSNTVLDTLSKFTLRQDIKKNLHLIYFIADCILKHDTINEDAIALKCSILSKLGKKGVAKNAYDSFAREYKNLLGTDYPIQFNDLLVSVPFE